MDHEDFPIIDRIAWEVYMSDMWEKSGKYDGYDYWVTLEFFVGMDDTEEYYEQANIILRKRKILSFYVYSLYNPLYLVFPCPKGLSPFRDFFLFYSNRPPVCDSLNTPLMHV